MGNSSTKFRKHLISGDEYAALSLYQNSADLRKGLDPNSPYGDNLNHNTPLHFVCKHAMKSLLRIFLQEKFGNPNKTNDSNETSLHCLCKSSGDTEVTKQKRLDCIRLIFQWTGTKLGNGEFERISIDALDKKQCTALHYAAKCGLQQCVMFLVNQKADLFSENDDKLTACDLAEKFDHKDIAYFLETKMQGNADQLEEEMDEMLDKMEKENYSGLRAQDLQEAKDQLLVETSDMLRVPLFTAEALLRNNEWSRETLLENWMSDPMECCKKSGVGPPNFLLDTLSQPSNVSRTNTLSLRHHKVPLNELTCDVCTSQIPSDLPNVSLPCNHNCCKHCWKAYLTTKIQDGDTHNITCPGYDCNMLIPAETIEELVSREMALKYLQFDIKAFVDSNPSIKWCPFPACGRAVKLPESDNFLSPVFTGDSKAQNNVEVSHSVDCGNGHMFCWECSGDPHEPASCTNWKKWLQKIFELKPESLNGTEEELEVAANYLWLITNTKSCPNCKSPIQKKEGCNHMKCFKCKHDFCWVCLESWKKHNSSTGGYFRCNRYDAVRKVEQVSEAAKQRAEGDTKRLQDLNKFFHYYTRFKNHENSFKIESPLLKTTDNKMIELAKYALTQQSPSNNHEIDTRFVLDAVIQLLKSRRILKCSYVYGYYLDEGFQKTLFEFMQTELEESTESLSQIIARPFLRTPRQKIIGIAANVQRKRNELLTSIAKGVIPPDCTPNFVNTDKKLLGESDEEAKKAFFESLKQLDPKNPWIKDPSGRHTNLAAFLDWPDSDDEQASETSISSANSSESHICAKVNCTNKCLKNPRTKKYNRYCVKCFRDVLKLETTDSLDEPNINTEDYSNLDIDLLRAIEMSKMQFVTDMNKLSGESHQESALFRSEIEERDLQKAIQLSLTESSCDESTKDAAECSLQSNPEYSTIVNVVPNKCVTSVNNTFGLIKDVNVANLLVEGIEKKDDFENKDMKIRSNQNNSTKFLENEQLQRLQLSEEDDDQTRDQTLSISDLHLTDVISCLHSLTTDHVNDGLAASNDTVELLDDNNKRNELDDQ